MKKKLLFLSVLTLLLHASSWAYDFSVANDDGKTIYYNILSEEDKTAEVTYLRYNSSYNSEAYSGNVAIPETATYNGSTYTVTSIGRYAFYECSGLTGELIIPEGVTSIGSYAFYNCTGLTGELIIPEGVTSIGSYAFYNCKGLTGTPTIPDGITTINDYAFYYCKGLTEITIPNSVTSIGSDAFRNCSGLTEITIPESVTSIGNEAFRNCSGLTEVNFNAIACTSAGSSSSGYRAFYGCSNISTFNFGDNVTIIPDYLCYSLTKVTGELTIPNSVTTIGSYAFNNCSGLTGELIIPEGVTTINSYAFSGCSGLTELTIPNSVTSIGDYAFDGCSGLYSISNISVTQTTCRMRITNNISGAESGVYYNYSFYSVDDDGCCTFTGLSPSSSYSYYFGIKLDNGSSSRHGGITVTTAGINTQITQVSLTPESLTVIGSYTAGDAEVTATGFTGEESDGVTLYLTNLEPKTQYTVEYYVRASGKKFTTSEKFTTPAVEFTTLPAKATSNTVALLGATTNLSDDAVGAGFEWRRNDAPSTMPSNQAECPVIDGELTGTLNGLSATTYYDFRPYYTSQGGKTYYGDWVTFITADAYVYFEPTVRTYSATSVGSSSATVKAYAVAGSDDITSQGFEYWEGGSSSAMNVKRASTTDENGVTRVEVSGQWMTATFDDLEPSTTYSYRAYVTTAVGTTYGETMSFTTDVPTGIEETMLTEDAEVHEIARYTLDGKKVSQPQRGINIIRYSDGMVKKVLVK